MSTLTRWTALVELGLRESLGGRRAVGLGLLALAPAALAASARYAVPGIDATSDLSPIVFIVGIGLVVPLICLVVGVGSLRDDLRDGTIVYLATRPVRRETIVAARVLSAGLVAALLGILSVSIAIPATGAAAEAWPIAAGATALSALAYTSAFAMLGVVTKRATLVGLVFLVAWEGVVASTPLVFRTWTLAYWVRSILVTDDTAASVVRDTIQGTPASASTAILVLALVALVAAGAGAAWFRSRQLAGPEPED